MPFELYITRCDIPELNITFPEGPARQDGITSGEFSALMAEAPAVELEGGNGYWVFHPSEQIPWFAAQWVDSGNQTGYLKLSVSWTHYRFLFAWGNLFDMALVLASRLNARVFEETRNSEVTEQNIDGLLSPESEYARFHCDTWKSVRSKTDAAGHAPLEFPVGPYDEVSEYCCFFVSQTHVGNIQTVCDNLSGSFEISHEHNGAMALSEEGNNRLARLLLRPDGIIQITPYYWDGPFSEAAGRAKALVDELVEKTGGTPSFFQHPLSPDLSEELEPYLSALGVDFYLWQVNYFRLEPESA